MFSELGLLVDLWLYHVVCIFALLCLSYAANYVLRQWRHKQVAFLESLRVHTGAAADTNL
uniref:ORF5a protein n=1 Tax=Free State vervet virus TaxID=1737586 RepID=A0A159D6S5_9NIDO|nr:ORF5a protein [Free State vervet virus]